MSKRSAEEIEVYERIDSISCRDDRGKWRVDADVLVEYYKEVNAFWGRASYFIVGKDEPMDVNDANTTRWLNQLMYKLRIPPVYPSIWYNAMRVARDRAEKKSKKD